jgi:NAD(P)-dependent dehydrogenase (short-subunit alcohol dehydrogenase family)
MVSAQAPIHSGFNARSTADDVIAGLDLSGKTAIVTGGCIGVGLEIARALASAGARVVLPTRRPHMARAALGHIAEGAEIESLDLMSPSSIDAFAVRFLASGRSLSILVNSADIMGAPPARDARGNESHLSANHLGHFQLAVRLWPALRRASGARVVAVSSGKHQISGVDFDDMNFERRPYDKWVAYGQSKTANALFAVAFDARGEQHGVRSFSLHSGTVVSPFARLLSPEIATFGVFEDEGNTFVSEKCDLKTVEEGAATAVWCATSPQLDGSGGVYCENCDVAHMTDVASVTHITHAAPNTGFGVRQWAVDLDLAERLWRSSENLTDARLP